MIPLLAADGGKHLAQKGERIKENEHVTPKMAPKLFRGWNLGTLSINKTGEKEAEMG